MTALKEEIMNFNALLDYLERAIVEGRRHDQTAWAPLSDDELQLLFHRFAQFYKSFCGTMSRLQARAQHSPNPEFVALYREACEAARTVDRDGELLLRWGMNTDGQGTWEIDFLELDYQLRVRRRAVLSAFQAFFVDALLPLVVRWQARLDAVVEETPPAPTLTVVPTSPRSPLRLRPLRLA